MNGLERLKEMFIAKKDDLKWLVPVIKYLLKREDLYEYYLIEEKNLIDLSDFINKKAKEQSSSNMSMIEDQEVYNWSVEYFKKSNEELGIIKPISKAKEDVKQMQLGVD